MRILILSAALITLIACNAASPAGSSTGASAANLNDGASGPAAASGAAAPLVTQLPAVSLDPAPGATATTGGAARPEAPAPAAVEVAAAMPALGAAQLAAQPGTATETPEVGPVAPDQIDAEPAGLETDASEFELAPTFSLPSAQGPSFALDTYAGSQNVVLVFYRAFW